MFKEMINTNKMKLSSQTSLILLAVVIGLFFVYAHIQETKYAPVKRAIPLRKALWMAKDPDWHLIQIDSPGWIEYRFYVSDSAGEKGEFVELFQQNDTGEKEPFSGFLPYSGDNMSLVLAEDGNLFLIKAKRFEKLIDEDLRWNPQRLPSCRLFVEDWEIVAPIKRFYMYSRHSRRFYPKEYIDEYDLKHGDYIPE